MYKGFLFLDLYLNTNTLLETVHVLPEYTPPSRVLIRGVLLLCAGSGSSSQNQQRLRSLSPVVTPPSSQPPSLSNLRPSSPTSPLGSEAKEFIEPCVEFDATSDLGGRTALHLAIAHQHTRVVNVLLSHTGQLPLPFTGLTYVCAYVHTEFCLAELPMNTL